MLQGIAGAPSREPHDGHSPASGGSGEREDRGVGCRPAHRVVVPPRLPVAAELIIFMNCSCA